MNAAQIRLFSPIFGWQLPNKAFGGQTGRLKISKKPLTSKKVSKEHVLGTLAARAAEARGADREVSSTALGCEPHPEGLEDQPMAAGSGA